jgi:hypothetical protein
MPDPLATAVQHHQGSRVGGHRRRLVFTSRYQDSQFTAQGPLKHSNQVDSFKLTLTQLQQISQ